MNFANLNRSEVHMRVVEREPDRLIEIRCFNRVVAADDFPRLTEWSLGYAHAAVFLLQDPSGFFRQAGAAHHKRLCPPGKILLNCLLHLFGTELSPDLTIIA